MLLGAAVALALFAWLLSFQSNAGRTYAAYGGVYVAAAVMRGSLVETSPPDRWDLVGAAVCLTGRTKALVLTHVALLAASVLLRWRDRQGANLVRYDSSPVRFRSSSASCSHTWRLTVRTHLCFPCAPRPASVSGYHQASGWVAVLPEEKRLL